MEKNYFGAIEFSSLYITAIIMSYHNGKLSLVARAKVNSEGYSNGNVIDPDAFAKSIANLKLEILDKYKINFDETLLVLPNNGHKTYSAKHKETVMTQGRIINQDIINKIIYGIKHAPVPENEMIVDAVPALYTLDNVKQLRTSPINQQASELRIDANLHTIPKTIFLNIKHALDVNGIKLMGQYLNCLCGAIAVTNKYDLENSCIHIDIGQEVTTISGFSKDLMNKSTFVNFGIDNLVTYLSTQLTLDKEEARHLFESYFVGNVDCACDVIFDESNGLSEKKITWTALNRLCNGFYEILDAAESIKASCGYNDDVSYLITGCLNNYENAIEEMSANTQIEFDKKNVEVIGLEDQIYTNVYGAIKLYILQNPEEVQRRFDSEENHDVTSNIPTGEIFDKTVRNNSKPTGSKFKDIFDD